MQFSIGEKDPPRNSWPKQETKKGLIYIFIIYIIYYYIFLLLIIYYYFIMYFSSRWNKKVRQEVYLNNCCSNYLNKVYFFLFIKQIHSLNPPKFLISHYLVLDHRFYLLNTIHSNLRIRVAEVCYQEIVRIFNWEEILQ